MPLSQLAIQCGRTSITNLFRPCWTLYLLAKRCNATIAFTNNSSKRLCKTRISLPNRLQTPLAKYHLLKPTSQTSKALYLNSAERILLTFKFKRKIRRQSSAYSIPDHSKTWQLSPYLKHHREGSRCLQMISSWIQSSWRT